jgi:hypothetical protein
VRQSRVTERVKRDSVHDRPEAVKGGCEGLDQGTKGQRMDHGQLANFRFLTLVLAGIWPGSNRRFSPG